MTTHETTHAGKHWLSRRESLRLIGAAGATALVGWKDALASATGAGSLLGANSALFYPAPHLFTRKMSELSCVVKPAQTEGPYFVDEKLNRSDIRLDPMNKAVREGLPLRLKINVSRVKGDSCAPLTGAYVDLWQCDALGAYSDVRDMAGRFDTRGQKFLRGYQVTDLRGAAEFQTIYPGWYTGRAVHIHFKIRLFTGNQKAYEFTSQLYFDETITDQVHAQAPYRTKGRRDVRNERDGIFRNGGDQLMLNLKPDGAGYVGTFDIGLT
jgi:protocatechuate 3,4-dioxygenase beta subunit